MLLLSTSIAIHINTKRLDRGNRIEVKGGKNAKYRSTRIDGKSI